MRLTPRYGGRPVMSVETRVAGSHPMVRQRARLVGLLGELADDEWPAPSRCAGWSVQDVVAHLTTVNGFWALAIQAGAAGEPTRYLATFDPVASPAQLVDRVRGTPVEDTLDQFADSCAALAAVVDGLEDADWDKVAEAPPGHLPLRLVADHALWDAWVHERDILVPLGRPLVEVGDEVLTSLRYAVGLGRVFELISGGAIDGDPVVLDVSSPAARIVVEVDGDAVRIHDGGEGTGAAADHVGDAVEVLEMVSMRDAGVPVPNAIRKLTAGLATVFDQ